MELVVDWMEIIYRFCKDKYNKKSDQRNTYIETNNNQQFQDRKNQLEKESIPSVRIDEDDDGDSSAGENDSRGIRSKLVEEPILLLCTSDKQVDEITKSEAIKIFEAAPERSPQRESLSTSAAIRTVKATRPKSKKNDDYLTYCMENPDS